MPAKRETKTQRAAREASEAIRWKRSKDDHVTSHCGRWRISPCYAGCTRPQDYQLWRDNVCVASMLSTQREAKEHAVTMNPTRATIVDGNLTCPQCQSSKEIRLRYTVPMYCHVTVQDRRHLLPPGKIEIEVDIGSGESGEPNDDDILACRACGATFELPEGAPLVFG